MARDSAVGRERILVVPSSLTLDNTTTNQHVAGAQNDLNQQILEVSILQILFISIHNYDYNQRIAQLKKIKTVNFKDCEIRFHMNLVIQQ